MSSTVSVTAACSPAAGLCTSYKTALGRNEGNRGGPPGARARQNPEAAVTVTPHPPEAAAVLHQLGFAAAALSLGDVQRRFRARRLELDGLGFTVTVFRHHELIGLAEQPSRPAHTGLRENGSPLELISTGLATNWVNRL